VATTAGLARVEVLVDDSVGGGSVHWVAASALLAGALLGLLCAACLSWSWWAARVEWWPCLLSRSELRDFEPLDSNPCCPSCMPVLSASWLADSRKRRKERRCLKHGCPSLLPTCVYTLPNAKQVWRRVVDLFDCGENGDDADFLLEEGLPRSDQKGDEKATEKGTERGTERGTTERSPERGRGREDLAG